MQTKFLLAVVILVTRCLCITHCLAAEASFEATDDQLTVQTPRWTMALDARTGAIRGIEDRTAEGTILQGGTNLWVVERHGDPDVEASACAAHNQWRAEKRELTLDFDGPNAAVTLVCTAAEEGPSWQAEVRMKRGTMIGWRFPNAVEFDVSTLNESVLPEHLGLAFTQSFFEPGGAGVERHLLGGRGLQQVAADHCLMRPVQDEPVAVRPGKEASGWLPQWYVSEMSRWRVTANRCPAAGMHDLSLVETEHGCWLSAYRLGGWGWLFRFGGMGDRDARPQIASVMATLSILYDRTVEDGKEVPVPDSLAGKSPANWPQTPTRIGVFLGRPTGRPGAQVHPDPAELLREFTRLSWVKETGIKIVVLRDPAELRAALSKPREWFSIVNTIAEGVPAEAADQTDSMLLAIREYVRNGGIWWEAGGGYPFHYAIVPRRDIDFATANRDFCDFTAINSEAGRWSLYGVRRADDIYTPARAEIAAAGPAGDRVGRYTHTFFALAKPDETVRLPRQQMVLGKPHREVLRDYGQRNGITRALEDKAKAEVVEKLKRCILLKVTTHNLKQSAEIAEQLPFPVLFHSADYLRGGFDKQYPDHLPPNPQVGTAEDLSRLIRVCHEKGHLFMPYTNPTWWCVNPKGPTFEKHGDAPLSRDLDGNVYPESYGESTTQGYAVCAWHAAVRAANDVTRGQFTQQYPVDVLFQDQIGARRPIWDINPASPHPGAYLEGLHRIARVDSALVPVATEDGHDRLINWETMFCGMSFPWLPNRPSHSRVLYEDLWPCGAWRIEPLALFLAHDKVLFYHHDLGGFVRNRRDLSITLAMGYGLSWWTHTVDPSETERDWIERLCRVQAAIGPRCAGRGLDEFEYLAPEVLRSQWGDLEIIANLTDEPWTIDSENKIAPEGFVARSPDLEAGIFARRAGKDLSPAGSWLIRKKQETDWSEWTVDPEPGR